MERKQTETLFRRYGTLDVDGHAAGHGWSDTRHEWMRWTKWNQDDYEAEWMQLDESDLLGILNDPIQDSGGNSRRLRHGHGNIGAGHQ